MIFSENEIKITCTVDLNETPGFDRVLQTIQEVVEQGLKHPYKFKAVYIYNVGWNTWSVDGYIYKNHTYLRVSWQEPWK